jgi:hypothetical protein
MRGVRVCTRARCSMMMMMMMVMVMMMVQRTVAEVVDRGGCEGAV